MKLDRFGERQWVILERAWNSQHGLVMPDGFLENRACKRLVARGMLISVRGFSFTNTKQLKFDNTSIYMLTPRWTEPHEA